MNKQLKPKDRWVKEKHSDIYRLQGTKYHVGRFMGQWEARWDVGDVKGRYDDLAQAKSRCEWLANQNYSIWEELAEDKKGDMMGDDFMVHKKDVKYFRDTAGTLVPGLCRIILEGGHSIDSKMTFAAVEKLYREA